MSRNHRNEFEETTKWGLLGQVSAVSAALGMVVGIGLGSASHANAPRVQAGSTESAYASARFDHSRIAASAETEAQPATF